MEQTNKEYIEYIVYGTHEEGYTFALKSDPTPDYPATFSKIENLINYIGYVWECSKREDDRAFKIDMFGIIEVILP